MKLHRWALSGLFVAAFGMAGVAHARDNVYWSIGVDSPGVSVGVANAPPLAVYPAPVYVPPYPVVVAPRPYYYYNYGAPVYYGPPGWHHGRGWHKKWREHYKEMWDDDD